MKVLIACEFSGTVRDEFIKRGHDAISCDIIDSIAGQPHIKKDVRDILNIKWDLIIAHPPCTYLTAAANKYDNFEKYPTTALLRLRKRKKDIELFIKIAINQCERICIENPIGIMSRLWKKPTQIIQPYMFGDPIRKATCLWLKNLPKLKATEIVEPIIIKDKSGTTSSLWHNKAKRKTRSRNYTERSITHKGIAIAMAEQWG